MKSCFTEKFLYFCDFKLTLNRSSKCIRSPVTESKQMRTAGAWLSTHRNISGQPLQLLRKVTPLDNRTNYYVRCSVIASKPFAKHCLQVVTLGFKYVDDSCRCLIFIYVGKITTGTLIGVAVISMLIMLGFHGI